MTRKRKIAGGILAVLGFMLSPLSWWNDAFVNLPLALTFAWLASYLCPAAWRESTFEVSLIVGYWLTNVLGFVLMHRGARQIVSREQKGTTRREIARDVWVSIAYTALILLLIKLGVLKPIESYFQTS